MAASNRCLLLTVAVMSIHQVFAIKASYERFDQSVGKEHIDLDLRVRKFNSTTMTLNGTIYVHEAFDDTTVFTSNVFHSRLGNQQFQHYPMRLPTSGFCQFMQNLHREYTSVVVDIVNIPDELECPVKKRTMYIKDKVFPVEVLPEQLANGLWKIVISGERGEEQIVRFLISVRLADDYFGI